MEEDDFEVEAFDWRAGDFFAPLEEVVEGVETVGFCERCFGVERCEVGRQWLA